MNYSNSGTSFASLRPLMSTCMRSEPELLVPVDERRPFKIGSISSIVTQLHTLGIAQLTGRAVFLLLLAWALLLDAITIDMPKGGTPLQGTVVGVGVGHVR